MQRETGNGVGYVHTRVADGMGDWVRWLGAVHILRNLGWGGGGGFPVLLPPKLQRRGLVFKGKMVTMERV